MNKPQVTGTVFKGVGHQVIDHPAQGRRIGRDAQGLVRKVDCRLEALLDKLGFVAAKDLQDQGKQGHLLHAVGAVGIRRADKDRELVDKGLDVVHAPHRGGKPGLGVFFQMGALSKLHISLGPRQRRAHVVAQGRERPAIILVFFALLPGFIVSRLRAGSQRVTQSEPALGGIARHWREGPPHVARHVPRPAL